MVEDGLGGGLLGLIILPGWRGDIMFPLFLGITFLGQPLFLAEPGLLGHLSLMSAMPSWSF